MIEISQLINNFFLVILYYDRGPGISYNKG